MATRQGTLTIHNSGRVQATWTGITENDTGTPISMAEWPDRTVQVVGDFTTSGAITLEGTNDAGTTYATLHDYAGVALVITDSTLHLIAENPERIRPRATAGSSVSMDVYIFGVK